MMKNIQLSIKFKQKTTKVLETKRAKPKTNINKIADHVNC